MKIQNSMIVMLLFLTLLFGCSNSDKIREIESELQDERQTNSSLYAERNSLKEELEGIKERLAKSNETISSYQEDQRLTKDIIELLATENGTGACKNAIEIAKRINRGYFDEIDRQMIVRAKKLEDMKQSNEERKLEEKLEKDKKRKEFHDSIASFTISCLKLLIYLILFLCVKLTILLVWFGSGIEEKLIRAGGVVAILISYFISSFYGYSLSSLMLSSTLHAQLYWWWDLCSYGVMPFAGGAFFALIIKHQIMEGHFYTERWIITVTTLLLCMLFDVFLNVEKTIGGHDIPVANATFIVGLFITLFIHVKPTNNLSSEASMKETFHSFLNFMRNK